MHPVGLFIILILALTWLAYVEGLHYAVVSLEKREMAEFEQSFPRAFKTHQVVNSTEKVKRFLVGRQFFTIFVVFIISEITSFPHIPQDFANMPKLMVNVLVQTGLPGVALVLTYGQLISQLYVEQYTLSFFNLYGVNFVTNVCLGAEYVGICHFSHLLFHAGSRLFCGNDIRRSSQPHALYPYNLFAFLGSVRKAEQTMRTTDNLLNVEGGVEYIVVLPPDEEKLTAFDYARYLWSTGFSIFSFVVVFYGIANEYYVLPTPPAATFIIFFLALTMLFYLEGIMIAVVAVQYWDRSVHVASTILTFETDSS